MPANSTIDDLVGDGEFENGLKRITKSQYKKVLSEQLQTLIKSYISYLDNIGDSAKIDNSSIDEIVYLSSIYLKAFKAVREGYIKQQVESIDEAFDFYVTESKQIAYVPKGSVVAFVGGQVVQVDTSIKKREEPVYYA